MSSRPFITPRTTFERWHLSQYWRNGKKLIDSIAELCSNEIPVSFQPLLFEVNLISLEKNCGGLRPIAVGETFRRLAGKCAASFINKKLAPMMAPMQLGAGVRFGAEAAAHAARYFICNILDDMVVFKIDFANAFNTVRIDCLAEAFKLHAPEVYPFVKCCYDHSSFLCYVDYVTLSSEGFQQGDPIAFIGFCVVNHHLLTSLASKFKCVYLDDISAGDNWQIVLQDLKEVTDGARQLDLMIKPN